MKLEWTSVGWQAPKTKLNPFGVDMCAMGYIAAFNPIDPTKCWIIDPALEQQDCSNFEILRQLFMGENMNGKDEDPRRHIDQRFDVYVARDEHGLVFAWMMTMRSKAPMKQRLFDRDTLYTNTAHSIFFYTE